jgi:hypothetical protein
MNASLYDIFTRNSNLLKMYVQSVFEYIRRFHDHISTRHIPCTSLGPASVAHTENGAVVSNVTTAFGVAMPK